MQLLYKILNLIFKKLFDISLKMTTAIAIYLNINIWVIPAIVDLILDEIGEVELNISPSGFLGYLASIFFPAEALGFLVQGLLLALSIRLMRGLLR